VFASTASLALRAAEAAANSAGNFGPELGFGAAVSVLDVIDAAAAPLVKDPETITSGYGSRTL
jgi:hypothetical protein